MPRIEVNAVVRCQELLLAWTELLKQLTWPTPVLTVLAAEATKAVQAMMGKSAVRELAGGGRRRLDNIAGCWSTLYVSGLPWQWTWRSVKREFGRWGEIPRVYLPPGAKWGSHRGFGFVRVESDMALSRILDLEGQKVGTTKGGKPLILHVRMAQANDGTAARLEEGAVAANKTGGGRSTEDVGMPVGRENVAEMGELAQRGVELKAAEAVRKASGFTMVEDNCVVYQNAGSCACVEEEGVRVEQEPKEGVAMVESAVKGNAVEIGKGRSRKKRNGRRKGGGQSVGLGSEHHSFRLLIMWN